MPSTRKLATAARPVGGTALPFPPRRGAGQTFEQLILPYERALRALAAEAGGVDYSTVAKAVARFGQRVDTSRQLQTLVAQAKAEMSNVQM